MQNEVLIPHMYYTIVVIVLIVEDIICHGN